MTILSHQQLCIREMANQRSVTSAEDLSPASAHTDLPTKQKRKLTLSACDPCRRRKTKCDGKRPICSACINKSNHICTWEVQDPSLSRTAALRSKLDEMEVQMERNGNHLKCATSLIEYLMTRPEAEAHTILKRLRSTQDIAATVQYVRDGDLLISGVLAPEPSTQSEEGMAT